MSRYHIPTANWVSVLEILLLARGTEVSSAVLAHYIGPCYGDLVEELPIPITVRPVLSDGRVSVYFRLDVSQEARRVLLKICRARNRAEGSHDTYIHDLERAEVHAAQARLHLAHASRFVPERQQRVIAVLLEGLQASLELLAVAKEPR